MARHVYKVPAPYLVAQAEQTASDLEAAAADPRNPYVAAGVDPLVHAAALAAAGAALAEAHGELQRAEAARAEAAFQAQQATEQSHRWLAWLGRLAAKVAAEGRPVHLRLDRRHSVRRASTLADLRLVLPDVVRQRATLAAGLRDLEVLDQGAALLADLEVKEEAVVTADGTVDTTRAAAKVAAATLVEIFRRVDRDVAVVASLTGSPPLGATRAVVRQVTRTRRVKDTSAEREDELV